MWPHHVILNGYVCIFSNKIMPRPNGRHVDLVAFFLLLLFLSFSVLFLLSVSFFFFLVKYICGSTLKACQTFEIGFAIRKTRKVSTVLGALSCATKRWGGKRRAHTWIADAKWLKPKHTIIQRWQNWRHYFCFNHLCVCVCVYNGITCIFWPMSSLSSVDVVVLFLVFSPFISLSSLLI